jgi:2'-5' RNA ligase
MQGIISLLDAETDQLVHSIWHEITALTGVDPVVSSLVPHISWHVASEYPFEKLHDQVGQLARQTSSFYLTTTGLGFFRIPANVLYISLAVTPALLTLHQTIFDLAKPLGQQPNPCYSPGFWVPHITLVYRIQKIDQIDDILTRIKPFQIEREICINNFALLCPATDGSHEICPFYFPGSEVNHGE